MQTSQVKTCKNCLLLSEMIEKLDRKLWELAEQSWNSKKFNLDLRVDSDLRSDLLHYKRILSKRVICQDYPCSDYSLQDIASKLLPKLSTSKKCLCFSIPPSQ